LLKRISLILVALLLLLSFSACGSEPAAPENTGDNNATTEDSGYEEALIRFGNFYNEATIYGQAVNKFKEVVESESGGKVTVDVFHGGTLGSEQEEAQAVKDGSLEMMFSGTAGVGLFVPATAIFEVWYAFTDIGQLGEAFDTLHGDLDAAMQAQGFKLLGAYYDGPRNILSNKKITKIEDLKNVKLRAPGAKIYVDSITGLGAQAVSMDMSDVYTALQTGGIDAMEGTTDAIYQQKFYEQGKYLIKDAHVFQPLSIIYNLDEWNALPEKTQELVQKAVKESMDYQMQLYQETLQKELGEITASGVEQVEITDRDKWVAAVQSATEAYVAQYGDLGKKIYDVVKSYQQ
ncbi:MAG TPA: TRAP transporter substrate-binding protein, partial [Anaerovoracaceae bacterium]|nr:TRAP transporter substrate-binding protein [Anaerovoracaceae bacterium]